MLYSEYLKKNDDYRLVYEKGRSRANKYLVMYVLSNGSDRNRIGISVSKKVGNSVIRHRFKRLVKENYRSHEAVFNSGLDIVIVARSEAAAADFKTVGSALMHLGKLHRIVKE